MARPCKLTSPNGIVLNLDYDDLTEMGPHINGGSFVVIKGVPIIVLESPQQILNLAKVVQ